MLSTQNGRAPSREKVEMSVVAGSLRIFRTGEVAIGGGGGGTRLAKVDVARQLTDDEDVQARNQLGLEAGGTDQLLVADGGAEVGEQAQVLAQPQNGLLGAELALQLIVLPVAHGAEQHSVGFFGQLQGGFGQGVAMGVVGHAAHQCGFHFQREVQGLEHLDGFGHDFGTNAVTRQYCDLHKLLSFFVRVSARRCASGWPQNASLLIAAHAVMVRASHGFCAKRWASKALILSAWRKVRPMSSKPLSRQYLRKACTSNAISSPWGLTITWRSRSMVSW